MKQIKKQAAKKQPAKKTTIKSNRTGESVANLTQALEDNMFYIQGKFQGTATKNDNYLAVAYTVRDRLLRRWIDSVETYMKDDVRLVCYFSAEFLLGPHLQNNLINLDLLEPMRKAVASYDVSLEQLFEQEEEPGLGNGGLGRLAACYMDSLSSHRTKMYVLFLCHVLSFLKSRMMHTKNLYYQKPLLRVLLLKQL
jgi:glucan phosphorylase